MYRCYLGEEFLNLANDRCIVIEMQKRHLVYRNKKYNETHLVLTREYEILTTYGSWRVMSSVSKMLYV